MSVSGVGRGRGWLKLKGNEQLPKPNSTPVSRPTLPEYIIDRGDEESKIPPQFSALITNISKLDRNDDGILFNRKLANIFQAWKECCPNNEERRESMQCVYRKCLQDKEFTVKTCKMFASSSASKWCIHDVRLRSDLITFMQADYENRLQKRQNNPVQFRNIVRIIGTFNFFITRFDGNTIRIFQQPLLDYFSMLLESNQTEDLAVFSEQLYLNGSQLRSLHPKGVDELLFEVRRKLINNDLTRVGKAWLLLALDVTYRFRNGLFPNDLLNFYQDELGEKVLVDFQGWFNELYIEIDSTQSTLNEFSSKVNVLQVKTPENNVHQCTSPELLKTSSSSQDGSLSLNCSSNDSGIKMEKWWNPADGGPKKAGRPILGIGASRNNVVDGMKDDEKKNRKGRRQPKGWEHDDRVENDYSWGPVR